jgi:hypothetical protein
MRARVLGAVAVIAAAGSTTALAGKPATPNAKPTTTVYKLNAALNRGQETAKPKGTNLGASGRFTATLNTTTGELRWALTWRKLSGPATAAQIATGARRVNGPVAVSLCGPCTTPVSGTTSLTVDQVKDLLAGRNYVNIQTTKNPAGEIRGQITKAPGHA